MNNGLAIALPSVFSAMENSNTGSTSQRQALFISGGKMDTRICVECGKEFYPRNSRHLTCSHFCLKIRNRKMVKLYRINHPDYYNRQKEAYKNPDVKERKKQWRLKNIEVVRAKHKAYDQRPDVKERRNAWRRSEHGKKCVNPGAHLRRARRRGVVIDKINYDWIHERDGFKCGICGKKVNFNLKYPHLMSKSYDHIIPISKGGFHVSGNLQLAHLKCNSRKSAKINDGVQQFLI